MADGIVSNLASKALELLGKEDVRKAASWWGARQDLRKLEDSISLIRARVRDAERRPKDASDEAIKEWLRKLRHVLYQTEDLFEVFTQRTEQSTLGNILFSTRYAKEFKSIIRQLDDIKSDMDGLNLSVLPAQEPLMVPLLEDRETSSCLMETVIERENEKKELIEMLLDRKNDGEDITVIPIVGFGGLGKTTLAQMVFNDERVQGQFDLTGWAYVPEIDNATVIMGKILQSFTGMSFDKLSLEQIEFHIIQSINPKKYLLVLDDLWEEQADRLKRLVKVLKFGKQGSKVIVTTRSDRVAKAVGTIEVPLKLGTLTDYQSWNLLKNIAFAPGQEDSNPRLSSIGKEIAQMCGNMPLAIKVVGSQLRSRYSEEEWLQVRGAYHPTTKRSYLDDVMAALKLSYDCLSPELKLCFAYCSLFPKGYEFIKKNLVHLWMAQGYTHQDNGYQLFGDLVAGNFFQISYKGYKMHDLLHHLAQYVAGDESIMLGRDESPGQICDHLVHVNLNGSKCPSSLKNAKNLRSLLNCNSTGVDDQRLLSKFQSLRVLSMDGVLNEKLLSNPIGRLIHLRYLKLQSDAIKFLPSSITRLVNLQTLNLELCYSLTNLPRDFARLVNLRHLLLPNNLANLPPEFGKLTSLQELNVFKVGKDNGIDSLPALNLEGNLIINFPEWRRDAIEEVKRATLKNNLHLTSLTLHLIEEGSTATAGEMNEMLRHLQLPPNLKHLMVCFYKGDEMPIRWVDGLPRLVSVEISCCSNCKVLPNLSGLPYLKTLVLGFLQDLEYVDNEDDEDNIRVGTLGTVIQYRWFFPSLEVLDIHCCYKLKGWTRVSNDDGERGQLVFPRLLKMKVESCPMLMSMPLAPKLESLDVCGITWKMVERIMRSNDDEEAASSSSTPPSSSTPFMSLKELEIKNVNDELISLSIGGSLCNLSKLRIIDCSQLRILRFASPNSIQELKIKGCRRLENISEGLQHLCRLQELVIEGCEELEMEEELQLLPLLSHLEIEDCPKVKSLPSSIQNRHSPDVYIDDFARREREDHGKKEDIEPFDTITSDVSKTVGKSPESESQTPSNKCSQLWATPLLVLMAIIKLRANVRKRYAPYTTTLVKQMVPSTEAESCRQLLAKFPNHLKMMFHCLLFPKDYKFDKERLIHLWSAAGLLLVEDDGDSFFHFLLEKRFIIAPANDDFSGPEIYKFNSTKFGFFSNKLGLFKHSVRGIKGANMIGNRFANYCDVSVTSGEIDEETFESLLGSVSKLRSLLFLTGSVVTTVPSHIFSALKFLRTLDLSCTGIKELPSSIRCAKELRYLDLSWTLIERLPYSIADLCELQALKLEGCVHLFSLPEGMNRLIKLRHLDFDILGQLTSMPEGIGALVELQTLWAFIVGNEDGCNIKELKCMNRLSGKLCLSGLEHVKRHEDAKEAELINKGHLSQLELRWSSDYDTSEGNIYVKVLEGLKPHTCLQDLQIICFPGHEFPEWVGDHSYTNLVSIMLYKCEECEQLPSLSGLPELETLEIIDMNGVRKIDDRKPFPKLKKLAIDGMESLKEWSGLNGVNFPSIANLTIKHCPKLSTVKLSLPLFKNAQSSASLPCSQVEIVNCPKLARLPHKLLSSSLQTLIIEDCPLGHRYQEGGKDRGKMNSDAKVWILQDTPTSDEEETGTSNDQ